MTRTTHRFQGNVVGHTNEIGGRKLDETATVNDGTAVGALVPPAAETE